MRRKVLAIMMMLTALAGTSITAMAEGNATVTFTEKNELVYSNADGDEKQVNLGDAFVGVAPGETRVQTITLVNSNQQKVDFYMSLEVLQALEDIREQATGAGYDVVLTAAGKELYHSALGGYTEETCTGSKAGLKEINDSILKDSVLVAALNQGEKADITLQITFDGEGMDNTVDAVDYSDALGQIGFLFQAEYSGEVTEQDENVPEGEENGNITQNIGEIVSLAVKTGDDARIVSSIVGLSVGILLFVATGKKKTEGQP